jgi:hypothetical protein
LKSLIVPADNLTPRVVRRHEMIQIDPVDGGFVEELDFQSLVLSHCGVFGDHERSKR